MRTLLKPLQWLYTIYALLVFVVFMIPVFLWSLLVMPLGRIKGGNLTYQACMLWGDLWFPLVGIWHKNIFEQKLKKHQSYIFVANHISYLDTPAIVKTFRRPTRPLGKAEMAKVPIFGVIYKNAIVSVDRSSAENRAKSVKELKALLRKEISVLVFPEGTFNETGKPLKDFYDGAFRIAIETGTPIKPILFIDTYTRMHYSSLLSLNPGRNRAIFLPEVSTKGLTIDSVADLKQQVHNLMEERLKKYKAPWIKAQ
jgi:1-acyl-sn-glycerol-3-phosphate acyltransferase